MRGPVSSAWFVVGASVLVVVGLLSLALALAEPQPQAPIVLQYGEKPVYLGPHEHSVAAVAFSPDGKTLATGSTDGCLRLWDAATGRLKAIHADDATRGLNGLAYSPDGRFIAVVGGMFCKEVVIWDTTAGRIAREFESPSPHSDDAKPSTASAPFLYKGKPTAFRVLKAVAFSPNGKILATAPDSVVLRDASTGNVLATLRSPASGVQAIAFTTDGKRLVVAGDDKKVRLWSVPGGALEATLDGATQPLTAVAVSPDGSRIVAVGNSSPSFLSPDRTPTSSLWVWDHPHAAARRVDLGKGPAYQIVFVTPATVLVASGTELVSVDLQGIDSARPRKIRSYGQDVLAVAVSPDHKLAACGGMDRIVDVVDLASDGLVHRLPGLTDLVSCVRAAPDGKRFASATIDLRFTYRLPGDRSFAARAGTYFSKNLDTGRMQPSEVRIWSADNGLLQTPLPLPPCQVTAIDFAPHGNQLVLAGWKPGKGGMLKLWDLKRNSVSHDFDVQGGEIRAVACSPDGRTLASGDAGGKLEIWNLPSAVRSSSRKFRHSITALSFSDDGKFLAVGGDRTVQLLNTSTDKVVRTLNSRSHIESLDFSPDGQRLAAGTRDPGLELWDPRSDGGCRTLKAAGDYVATMPGFVAFSPNGRFVACGGHGKDIAVFNAADGTLYCELRGHEHPATTAVFLPDGRLLSGGEERTVRLWDVNQKKLLATWIAAPADEKQGWGDEWVGFTPSGLFVSSSPRERLVGWLTGGEFINGPDDGRHKRSAESLFPFEPSPSPGRK